MKAVYEQYEQIERYLTGDLSGNELAAFENRLETDGPFREEVQAHQVVHDLVIDQGLLELRSKMKAYEAGYTGSNNSLHIVSTIVLVLSLSAIGLITSNPLPPAPAAMVVTEPEKNNQTPVVADRVVKAEASLPAVIATPRHTAAIPDTSPDTITSSVPPMRLSQDTVTVTRRFMSDVLSKDVIPSVMLPEVKMPDVVPCRLQGSVLKLRASESCTTSPTGAIIVDKTSFFEGTLPVEFSIDGKNYAPGYTFSNLYAGTYYLSVRDARGCTWFEAEAITVGEKDCSEHAYSFYPDKGEVWKLPVSASSSGKIDIYSRNGSLVYTGTITHGYPDHWDGTANGYALPMGSYSFVLRADGKVVTGYVTLFK